MKITQCVILFAVATATAFNVSANAQSLQADFDFTKYGTVTPGSTVTANTYGSLSGTLNAASTSLTSGGLAISGASNAGTTGLRLANGSLGNFTGDFSLQQFYTNTALNDNTVLFGGTTAASQNSSLSGTNALFVAYGQGGNRFVRPIENNGSQFGTTQDAPANTGNTTGTQYDLILTYVASTHQFTEYLNGVQVAQGVNTSFSSLNAVTNFSIAGVANPAFGDNAAQETTTSFRFYTGALSQSQVTTIDGFGPNATVAQIGSAGVTVPEPATWAICLAGIGTLIGFQRTRRRPS